MYRTKYSRAARMSADGKYPATIAGISTTRIDMEKTLFDRLADDLCALNQMLALKKESEDMQLLSSDELHTFFRTLDMATELANELYELEQAFYRNKVLV
jgi:hypothetical protein